MLDADHTEIWKPVVGYETHYSVSSHGRIRRELRHGKARPGTILRWNMANRYPCVNLCKWGAQVKHFVHRLVAATFIGPCPTGYQVNHLDGNKSNPVLENLEYVTPKGNVEHAIRTGLIPGNFLDEASRKALAWSYANSLITIAKVGRKFGVCDNTARGIVGDRFEKRNKINATLARKIRTERNEFGLSLKAIGAKYGLTRAAVCRIARGNRWAEA